MIFSGFIIGVIAFVLFRKYSNRYIPVVGDVLTRRAYANNPFNNTYIKITEIKGDWVQYMFMPDADSSHSVSRFSTSMSDIKEFYIKVD